jgi:hypothetical protein
MQKVACMVPKSFFFNEFWLGDSGDRVLPDGKFGSPIHGAMGAAP